MNREDAILALKKLGYKKFEINSCLKSINLDLPLTDIIKQALATLKQGFCLQASKSYLLVKSESYVFEPIVHSTNHWMLNTYAKHTDLTQEDVEAYFKAKEEKEKLNK